MMFGLTAILTILFHLAPNLGGMAWSIYQNKGVHLVAPQSSKGSAMKPKIIIHNHYQRPTRDRFDGGPGSGPSGGGSSKEAQVKEVKRLRQELAKVDSNQPGALKKYNEISAKLEKAENDLGQSTRQTGKGTWK
jgi:hypothetical protein